MNVELNDILIVREFPDVFPNELPGELVDREIEFTIETVPAPSPFLKLPTKWLLPK